ncbi:MAG: hypothetical protein ACTSXH_18180 [Promethearchaeota archaeon]
MGSEVIGQFFDTQEYLRYLVYFEDKPKSKPKSKALLFKKLMDSLARLFVAVDKEVGKNEIEASIQPILEKINLIFLKRILLYLILVW